MRNYRERIEDKANAVTNALLRRVRQIIDQQGYVFSTEVELEKKISSFLASVSANYVSKGVIPVFTSKITVSPGDHYYDDDTLTLEFGNCDFGPYPYILWICVKKYTIYLNEKNKMKRFVRFVNNRFNLNEDFLRNVFYDSKLFEFKMVEIIIINSLKRVKIYLLSDFHGSKLYGQKMNNGKINPDKPIVYVKGNKVLLYGKDAKVGRWNYNNS